ncbi:DegV family protein [Lentilactobacillus kosonis]|uniref:DegV family protein n=1 Tax=Lentilactobacillus kosonis TaxID=2810561 RepID=A0A401FJ38_9LACO|nr:DegV family protein [Lentilactobacillus kosonis]
MITKDYSKATIHVYDSHVTVQALGYMVKYAAKLANESLPGSEIIDKLNEMRDSLDEYFVVNDLKNLVVGGRLTNAAAFAGSLLKIKPVLTLNEKYSIVAIDKIRTLKKARAYIEDKFKAAYEKSDFPLHVLLTGTNNQESIDEWKAEMVTKYPNATFESGQIGPVVGTHIGSDAFVILWLKQF